MISLLPAGFSVSPGSFATNNRTWLERIYGVGMEHVRFDGHPVRALGLLSAAVEAFLHCRRYFEAVEVKASEPHYVKPFRFQIFY